MVPVHFALVTSARHIDRTRSVNFGDSPRLRSAWQNLVNWNMVELSKGMATTPPQSDLGVLQ